MKTNEEYTQEWLSRLQNVCNKSPGTIKQYKSQINQFGRFINKSFTEVKCNDIELFLSSNQEIKTKQFKQSIVCSFYNWMCDHDYVQKHPMMSRITFGAQDKLLKFLEQDQVRVINDYFQNNIRNIRRRKCQQRRYFIDERNYALFQFMISTGVRSSEALGIKKSDLDLIKNEVRIIRKRKKEQVLSFKHNLRQILRAYLDQCPNESEYLFPSKFGEKMCKSSLDNIFKNITKTTGIFIHPHMTRSTFACWAIDNGMKPEDLQKYLGHENPATTQIYYDIRDENLKKAIN